MLAMGIATAGSGAGTTIIGPCVAAIVAWANRGAVTKLQDAVSFVRRVERLTI